MRIRDLRVDNLLHFHAFELQFGDEPHGLHIIHGPNEAGKSTLLRLFIDLLYGGKIADESTSGYSRKSVLTGTLEPGPQELAATDDGTSGQGAAQGTPVGKLAAASSGLKNTNRGAGDALPLFSDASDGDNFTSFLTVRRIRKGKRLVLAADDEAVTEDLLHAFVGGLNRDRYELLFGFDHLRLRQGGDSLLQSGGHAGISLFEAGGGVQFLRQLSEGFTQRTQELLDTTFRANSNKALNVAWRSYKDLLDNSRKSRLRGEDWHRLRDDIEKTEQRLAAVQEERASWEQRQSQLERIQRTRWFVVDLQKLHSDWSNMSEVQELGEEHSQQISQTIHSLDEIEKKLDSLRDRRKVLDGELRQLPLDGAAIAAEAEIQRLHQRLELYLAAAEALPGLAAAIHRERERGTLLLKDLVPDMQLDDIEGLRIPFAQHQVLRDLAEEYLEMQRNTEQVAENVRNLTAELERVEEKLLQTGDGKDVTDLRRTLTMVHRAGDVDSEIAKAAHEAAEHRAEAEKLLKQQTVFVGMPEELQHLPLPLSETLRQYEQRFSDAERGVADLRREIGKTEDERNQIANELQTLDLGGRVPVEADLVAARTHRDWGWNLVKRAWLQGAANTDSFHSETADFVGSAGTGAAAQAPLQSVSHLAAAYEQALQAADEISDRIRKESDRSARRSQLLLQQDRVSQGLSKLQDQLAKAEEDLDTLKNAWQQEWAAAGISPKSPMEMRDWITNSYRLVIEELHTVDSHEQHLEELRNRQRALAAALTTALTGMLDSGQDTRELREDEPGQQLQHLGLAKLTVLAESRIQEIDENRRRREQLLERQDDIQTKLTEQRYQQRDIEAALLRINDRWSELRRNHQHLPNELTVVRPYLDRLRDLFEWFKEYQRLLEEERVKRQTCRDFEAGVEALAVQLQEPIDTQTRPDNWVRSLVKRLDGATRAQSVREGLERQREGIDKDGKTLLSTRDRYISQLNAYLQQHGCEDQAALQDLVEQAEAKHQLRTTITALEQNLRQAGDGLAVETLVSEVTIGPDVDALPVELEKIRHQLEKLQEHERTENRALGALKQEFADMNASKSDAADYLQQAEFQLAQVDMYWKEYLRLELASRLLQTAVEKFREMNQAGIVERASAIFSRLTLGQYEELVVEYDGDDPVLEAVQSDSTRRRVGQMSDGTRDQLYLSLRLAFVEQHIDSAGPVPLVMDDILVHFDDERTEATLSVLQELAEKTQILYFTHHRLVVDTAEHWNGITVHKLETNRA